MSLNEIVDTLIQSKKNSNITDQLQTEIDPEIRFRRNSVNLLIGKKGSGKTYNVFREIMKLCLLEDNPYSLMIYVTDHLNDETHLKYKDLITIPIIHVTYSEATKVIEELTEAKTAYDQVKRNKLENRLTEESKKDILEPMRINDFSKLVHHTAVLLDDCGHLFKNKKGDLYRMLFRNRQPKITYFLCLQDVKQIDTEIKANVDSLWLFGGFPWNKFTWVTTQFQLDFDKNELWKHYSPLTRNDFIFFDYALEGTKISVVNSRFRI